MRLELEERGRTQAKHQHGKRSEARKITALCEELKKIGCPAQKLRSYLAHIAITGWRQGKKPPKQPVCGLQSLEDDGKQKVVLPWHVAAVEMWMCWEDLTSDLMLTGWVFWWSLLLWYRTLNLAAQSDLPQAGYSIFLQAQRRVGLQTLIKVKSRRK